MNQERQIRFRIEISSVNQVRPDGQKGVINRDTVREFSNL